MQGLLKVGQLASATGKSIRAIRLYEEMGLLASVARTRGRFRLFGREAIDRLDWITDLQDMGMSLSEIRQIVNRLREHDSGTGAMCAARDLYRTKLDEVRRELSNLIRLEGKLVRSLEYLDVCPLCECINKEDCFECRVKGTDLKPSLVRGMQAGEGLAPVQGMLSSWERCTESGSEQGSGSAEPT